MDRFLHSSSLEMTGLKVLDLGCGAALPGLYCFSKGAEGEAIGFYLNLTFSDIAFVQMIRDVVKPLCKTSNTFLLSTVWFNDYNEEVLKHITMPNTLLNVPKNPAKTRCTCISNAGMKGGGK